MTEQNVQEALLNFRRILNEMDWSKDGFNDKQGYSFLTDGKISSNFRTALIKAGLEWDISYDNLQILEPIGAMKQHYIIQATATLSVPGRFSESFRGYGEAADSGDKAISKAQTNAKKNIIKSNWLIADIDDEGESIIENSDSIKAEARSGYEAKVLIDKDKVVRANQAASQQVSKPAPVQGDVSESQRKVMDKIVMKAKTISDIDLEQFGTIQQIEGDYANVKSASDAQNFITAYTGVLRCQ